MNKKSTLALVVTVLVIAGGLYFAMHERALAPTVPVTQVVSTSTTDVAATTTDAETGLAAPRIDSVTPAQARIGDSVTIRGNGFSGFEGDKYAWIENTVGEKGIIYGDQLDKKDLSAATNAMIRFTLGSKYCTRDTSYSGLPCPSYITIVHGAYKVFVYPWGKTSNKVDFTVVK